VRTLVGELGGSLRIGAQSGTPGTEAVLEIPL
jgi:hypothetical protein